MSEIRGQLFSETGPKQGLDSMTVDLCNLTFKKLFENVTFISIYEHISTHPRE